MKRLLIAGALASALAGPALAADLAQPPPPPPPQAPAVYVPTVAPVYNWGGIYFGANAGYAFGQSNWTTPVNTTGSFDVSGAIAGPTLGFNYQIDAFVFGVEGDFDGSWITGNTSICGTPACQTNNNWIATARVRAGYAADRVLFYVTGGGAFGSILGNTVGTTMQKANEPGWVAGGGIEAALTDNITARLEYLYADLEHASLTGPTSTITPVTVDLSASLIRVGLDYKFR